MREMTRMDLDKSSAVVKEKKYKKSIEKLSNKIEKNIKKYNEYEPSYKNKPVVAYVMLRSMEGQARLIKAYSGS